MGTGVDDRRLPVFPDPLGGFKVLVMRMHELTIKGRNPEALRAADVFELIARLAGDARGLKFAVQTRMYALIGLGRLQEALAAGESLLRQHRAAGNTVDEAKTLADVAEILIRLGRLDEGLQSVARAIILLDQAPRAHARYLSALSSLGDAARAAELYELADTSARSMTDGRPEGHPDREAGELQRAEFLVEWALRLEHIGRADEAISRYQLSERLLGYWVEVYRRAGHPADAPLATALLAIALVKLGQVDEAVALAGPMIVPMRDRGQFHEARLAHLAYGIALRARGDYREARREFVAAEELTASAGQTTQRLIIQHELALLAVAEHPEAGRHVLTALRAQAQHLWSLRLERIAMLRQARRRMELEAEWTRADAAAFQDPLTGLGNRRRFDQQMALLDRGVESRPNRLVLLLVDVDKFKDINDTYSHGVGDRVLVEIARALQGHCRRADVPVRFGGDEFAIFVPGDLATAARIGERIRRSVATYPWHEIAPGMRVTVSMGAAALRDGMVAGHLFDAADRQLYAAKHRGRDQLAA
ncbi:tetratricopeptide repeat-containing diguanylate cyclase [Planosporangium mesophilum]|uniref:Diguanylate cyclase n=1 Tax=Planosporangium mesophilum TaxID=689768 RepID=A0A8J3TAB6_9ACTN|nr:GGDEF domain-containing protein [Planosporangium mesophilum]NJC86090.1 GGDEF domain-containing protein [Planosporangium mesophilum]GII21522.1 diguanylate cyclase [Planosporangium mesophilum]